MSALIAVVGGSGNVGAPLARTLLARGVRVRVIGRSRERMEPLVARGAEPFAGSVDDVKFLAAAFRGADAVLAMIPPDPRSEEPVERGRRLAEAMAAAVQVARVQRVVTLSSVGAELPEGTGPIRTLHGLEQRFDQTPAIHLVHLRPSFFFENFLAAIPLIRHSGLNGSAFGPDVSLDMNAARDVADAAAAHLAAPDFTGRTVHELHGPRSYTHREATAILGAAIGRPELPYQQFSYEDFIRAMVSAGLALATATLYAEMCRGFNEGRIHPRAPRSTATTTPTSLEEFARSVFAPAFAG